MSDYDVTCKECGATFQRRTLVGRRPERCGDCKSIKKQKQLNKLRVAKGREPYPEDRPVLDPPRQPPLVDKPDIPPLPDLPKYEESWLDDDAAQAQLIAERSTIIEAVGPLTPEPEDPDRLSCSVRSCQSQPTQVNRFCLNHWLRVPLDLRGVLLSTTPGTPPFDSAMVKALKALR